MTRVFTLCECGQKVSRSHFVRKKNKKNKATNFRSNITLQRLLRRWLVAWICAVMDHVATNARQCRFPNGSRSLGLMGFAASRNKADAWHYDLPYFYNPQQVAVVLAIQSWSARLVCNCVHTNSKYNLLPDRSLRTPAAVLCTLFAFIAKQGLAIFRNQSTSL